MWPFSRAHCSPGGLGSVSKEPGEKGCMGRALVGSNTEGKRTLQKENN